ncbi:MAG: hypothetical protein WD357_09070 [Gracilimonas sp.]
METAFAIFIVIHGLIHMLGVLKAFEFAKIEEFKIPINKVSGIIWLLTSFILIATAIFYLAGSSLYIGLGVTGVTLSQALIWQDWKDAKYGSIPNTILGIALLLSL